MILLVFFFIYMLFVDYLLILIIGVFLGFLIFGCVVFFILGIWKNIILCRINVFGKKKKLIIFMVFIIIYVIGVCYIFIYLYNMFECIMIMVEKSVKEKNWENVLI